MAVQRAELCSELIHVKTTLCDRTVSTYHLGVYNRENVSRRFQYWTETPLFQSETFFNPSIGMLLELYHQLANQNK